jgi:hypothetical protein
MFYGCSSDLNENNIYNQNTPEEVIQKVFLAISNNNQTEFVECFAFSNENELLLHSIFEGSQIYHEFRNILDKTYGENAWDKYKSTESGKVTLELVFEFDFKSKELLNSLNIDVENNTALWNDAPNIIFKYLICQNDIWYFDTQKWGINPKITSQVNEKVNNAVRETIIIIQRDHLPIERIKTVMAEIFLGK